jgi:hypothetical protein
VVQVPGYVMLEPLGNHLHPYLVSYFCIKSHSGIILRPHFGFNLANHHEDGVFYEKEFDQSSAGEIK